MRTVLSWAQYLRGMTDQMMSGRDERGEGVVTNVIWIALFAAAAIGIATIIITKFTGKAESIPTG